MGSFKGFPEGKTRLTPLPGPFFTELLPAIDDLDELKLTVYLFWRLDRLEGSFRYLRLADFLEDERFMTGLAGEAPGSGEARLRAALERALQRGTLLKASVHLAAGEENLYFLNSPRGRAAAAAVQRGEWSPSGQPQMPVELSSEPLDVFSLYETHIGPLTPMISEALKEAENTYPAKWIEDAIRIAVEQNKRSWRYAEAILRRWKEEGRDEPNRRDAAKVRGRYADWEK